MIINKRRWHEDADGNRTKIHIDDALCGFGNFLGYQGNPPTDADSFASMVAMGGTKTLTVWKEGTSSPTWDAVLAKQTELTTLAEQEIADKVSAYRKLSMTDAEINAINPTLLGK